MQVPVAGAIYLRYPIFVDDPKAVTKQAKSRGVLLGNWYHNVIDPTGVVMGKINYVPGSCPRAERAAGEILNLPTLIPRSRVETVLRTL